MLSSGKHVNRKLLAAWRKYGASAFSLVMIEIVVDRDSLLEREQSWLSTGHYNLAPKADRPPGMIRKFTADERQRFSDARKGKPKPWLLGRKQSPEHVERAHAKMRGIKRPDVGRKISAAKQGKHYPRISESLIGNRRGAVPCSQEKRDKISESLRAPAAQEKLSATWRGRKQSADHVAKRVAKQIGQKRTPEMKARMRAARLAFLERQLVTA